MALRYEPKLMKIADGAAGGTPIRCTEATYKHNLEGVDELTIATTEKLDYTDRVLFQDRMSEWHEMMYDTGRHGHETGDAPSGSVKLYSSVNELWDSYVLDKRPSGNVAAVLSVVLGGTRWTFGQNVDVDGTRSFVFYHKSVRECIKEVCDSFGCFFRPRIEVQNGKIVARRIDVFRELGETPKRFTWTKDLLSVYREVGDEKPKTRIYGWGKGVETDSGGYGRRLSFADVNGGRAYVEDTDATAALGYVGYDGKRMPLEGEYVNESCEDAAQLLAETKAYLAGVSQPSVRYTADVISLADFGREWENVQVGETAAIVDKEFSEDGLRLRGQVAEMTEDLINQRTVVSFGTITDILSARQARVSQQLAAVRDQSAGWQVTTDAGVSWLNRLMSNLNSAFDAAGTYRFSSFEVGDIWSSVPLDENGRATKPGGWAINLNGMGIRLASSLNSDGSWNWRAFGTGKGFVADEINTGKLTDKKGLNFWNLETGEFSLASTAKVGGKTVSNIADAAAQTAVDAQTQQSIFNKLTNNGQTQGIYLSGGKVYINGTYINVGTLDASKVTIENLARIGKDGGWHLALGGDNITMTDEKDAAAMVIKGKKQAVVGWQQTNFRFGVEYEVPEAAVDSIKAGMPWRHININFGYIAEYFGTQSAQYEVSQPYPETTALIEHRGHGSGTSLPASQTFVQLHFKFNQNGKTVVWATARDADMRDITSQVENLPFIALSFKVDKPSVDINLADGADSVLTKQNFDELMSAGGTVPYTGTFTVVYARNNIFRYIDLTFVNGLLITTATRTL